jgi:hypothetical protein
VLTADSGVSSLNDGRGTNHSSDPLREQIEQLQDIAWSMSPSASNRIPPQ